MLLTSATLAAPAPKDKGASLRLISDPSLSAFLATTPQVSTYSSEPTSTSSTTILPSPTAVAVAVAASTSNCPHTSTTFTTNTTAGSTYSVNCGTDSYGNAYAISDIPSGGFQACMALCDVAGQCSAWSYYSDSALGADSGICFLKEDAFELHLANGYVSGSLERKDVGSLETERELDE